MSTEGEESGLIFEQGARSKEQFNGGKQERGLIGGKLEFEDSKILASVRERIGEEESVIEGVESDWEGFEVNETVALEYLMHPDLVMNAEAKEMRRRIGKAIEEADGFVMLISQAIGDSVLQTADFRGLKRVIQKSSKRKRPVMLLVRPDYYNLYSTFADEESMTSVRPLTSEQLQIEDVGLMMSKFVRESVEAGKKVVCVSLPSEIGSRLGKHDASVPRMTELVTDKDHRVMVLRNIFNAKLLELWTEWGGKELRFSEYINDLTGYYVSDREAQPLVELPKDEKEKYREISEVLGLEDAYAQIGFTFQTQQWPKFYPLEKWQEVADGFAKILTQRYPKKKIVFNIFCSPPWSKREGFTKGDIEESFGKFKIIYPNLQVNYLQFALEAAALLIKNQNLFVGTDTGLAQIASAVRGGPPTLSIYLPEVFRKEIWTGTNRHHGITYDGEFDVKALDKAIENDRNGLPPPDGFESPIVHIPPDEIVKSGMRYMYPPDLSRRLLWEFFR